MIPPYGCNKPRNSIYGEKGALGYKTNNSITIIDTWIICYEVGGNTIMKWLGPAQDVLFALILWYVAKIINLS